MTIKKFLIALIVIIGAKFAFAGDIIIATKSTPMYEGYTVTELLNLGEHKLAALLPEDADRSDMKKQRRAIKRGLYWSTSRTIKPLDDTTTVRFDG